MAVKLWLPCNGQGVSRAPSMALPEETGREWRGMASAPDDAPGIEPVEQLEHLIGQFRARLMAHEAFRALVQLEAREAEGRPLQGLGSSGVAKHLEIELGIISDFRAYRLLRQARAELSGAPVTEAAVPSAGLKAGTGQPEASAGAAAQPAEAVRRPATADASAAIDHSASSAAVAAMFAARIAHAAQPAEQPLAKAEPAKPVALPTKPANRPALIEAIAAAPAPPPAAANPTLPAFERVDAAGVDVLASVARLRSPDAPPEAAVLTAPPVSAGVVPPPSFAPSLVPDTVPADPRAAAASMEGTMASMAKAVAVTVAAAGRLAGQAGDMPKPFPAPAAPALEAELFTRQGGQSARTAEMAPSQGATTEIRFVARPANPSTDALPHTLSEAQPAAIPVGLARQSAMAPQSGYEEASVEIRRPDALGAQRQDGQRTNLAGDSHGATRTEGVLNRFVKALRRDKD
jgi:hypothetical protein